MKCFVCKNYYHPTKYCRLKDATMSGTQAKEGCSEGVERKAPSSKK